MTTIRVTAEVRRAIVAHAIDEAPLECCGLLVGEAGLVDESVRTRNVDPDPAVRYRVDPAQHIALVRSLRGTPRAVLGCYHSHPRSAAWPSASDRAEALWPEFVWLIVSLGDPGGPGDPADPVVRAFRITPSGVQQLTLG